MYSQKLEAIIDAALADGVLTDKERAVLHKKAAEEGVDPDELDVVIEGRLAKMKKETDWLRPTPPKENTKMGNVQKCPACGAPYQPGMGSCPECGHVFQNVASNKSSKELASKISSLMTAKKDKDTIIEEIANFPLPSSKDDLLEFITSMDAKRKEQGDYQKAYRVKYREAISKAKTVFPDDPQLQSLIKRTDKFSLKHFTKNEKMLSVICILILLLVVKSFIINPISKKVQEESNKVYINKAQIQYDSLCGLINKLPIPDKTNYKECEKQLNSITWKEIPFPADNEELTIKINGRDRHFGRPDENSIKGSYLTKKHAYARQIFSVYNELYPDYYNAGYKAKLMAPSDIESPEIHIKN